MDAQGSLMSRRALGPAALLVACVLLASILVADYVEAGGELPQEHLPKGGSPIDHDLNAFLGRRQDKPHYNYRTSAWVVALAAPDAAGTDHPRIAWPEQKVTTMANSGPADGEITGVPRGMADLASGDRTFVDASYEVTVTPAQVRAWTRDGRVCGRPWSVYVVRGDEPDDTVRVMQDRTGTKVYVVPEHLAEGSD